MTELIGHSSQILTHISNTEVDSHSQGCNQEPSECFIRDNSQGTNMMEDGTKITLPTQTSLKDIQVSNQSSNHINVNQTIQSINTNQLTQNKQSTQTNQPTINTNIIHRCLTNNTTYIQQYARPNIQLAHVVCKANHYIVRNGKLQQSNTNNCSFVDSQKGNSYESYNYQQNSKPKTITYNHTIRVLPNNICTHNQQEIVAMKAQLIRLKEIINAYKKNSQQVSHKNNQVTQNEDKSMQTTLSLLQIDQKLSLQCQTYSNNCVRYNSNKQNNTLTSRLDNQIMYSSHTINEHTPFACLTNDSPSNQNKSPGLLSRQAKATRKCCQQAAICKQITKANSNLASSRYNKPNSTNSANQSQSQTNITVNTVNTNSYSTQYEKKKSLQGLATSINSTPKKSTINPPTNHSQNIKSQSKIVQTPTKTVVNRNQRIQLANNSEQKQQQQKTKGSLKSSTIYQSTIIPQSQESIQKQSVNVSHDKLKTPLKKSTRMEEHPRQSSINPKQPINCLKPSDSLMNKSTMIDRTPTQIKFRSNITNNSSINNNNTNSANKSLQLAMKLQQILNSPLPVQYKRLEESGCSYLAEVNHIQIVQEEEGPMRLLAESHKSVKTHYGQDEDGNQDYQNPEWSQNVLETEAQVIITQFTHHTGELKEMAQQLICQQNSNEESLQVETKSEQKSIDQQQNSSHQKVLSKTEQINKQELITSKVQLLTVYEQQLTIESQLIQVSYHQLAIANNDFKGGSEIIREGDIIPKDGNATINQNNINIPNILPDNVIDADQNCSVLINKSEYIPSQPNGTINDNNNSIDEFSQIMTPSEEQEEQQLTLSLNRDWTEDLQAQNILTQPSQETHFPLVNDSKSFNGDGHLNDAYWLENQIDEQLTGKSIQEPQLQAIVQEDSRE